MPATPAVKPRRAWPKEAACQPAVATARATGSPAPTPEADGRAGKAAPIGPPRSLPVVGLGAETDRKVQQGREKSRDEELSITIRSIRKDIQDIIDKLPERINNKYFKPGDFQYEINKAKNALDDLLEEYDKLRP